MRLPKLLQRGARADHGEVAFGPGGVEIPAATPESEPDAVSGAVPKRIPARADASTMRLDELRTQARFARQRYDLYKAKTYGPRLTSPSRLQELERESARAQASLAFAKAQAAREAG